MVAWRNRFGSWLVVVGLAVASASCKREGPNTDAASAPSASGSAAAAAPAVTAAAGGGSLLSAPRIKPAEMKAAAEMLCGLPAAEPAHVAKALNLTQLELLFATHSAGDLQCSYSGPKDVQLFVSLDSSARDFAYRKERYQAAVPDAKVEPYANFGDEAFQQTIAMSIGKIKVETHLLSVRRGDISLSMISSAPFQLLQAWGSEILAQIH